MARPKGTRSKASTPVVDEKSVLLNQVESMVADAKQIAATLSDLKKRIKKL